VAWRPVERSPFDSIDAVENVPHLENFPQFAGVSLCTGTERAPD
jgi:hypothetical protein